ncbi:39S ribosomal protein L40, mitochondrial [Spea bombifrons]|uniref:39S ribosomal protein L40, mitochondrial n=1 Tax=Spea bombifrons TaxID=233779 RepID=UPI00234A4F6B|nr:39S ribosomal protein L40, mitochondrial [Spea bombifrons]
MSSAACNTLLRVYRQSSRTCPPWIWKRESHWQTSLLTLRSTLPMRAEPKKKKKVDPKREQAVRERMKKRLKKLERIPPQLIPIEDFTRPAMLLDETRVRTAPQIPPEEQERRALLMKTWALHKQKEHEAELKGVESLVESQREALQELRLESEDLYNAAVLSDPGLLPLESKGPCHTPPIPQYSAPEGKYNDITKVYTQ